MRISNDHPVYLPVFGSVPARTNIVSKLIVMINVIITPVFKGISKKIMLIAYVSIDMHKKVIPSFFIDIRSFS